MKLSVLLFCLFFLLSAAAPQTGPTSRNVLVLLSDNNYRETHSLFFNSLKDKGQKLTFGLANDPDVKFEKYGQFLYDSVILVVSEAADINVDGLLNFIDSGKNVFIATDSLVPERVRELARENGVEFDDTQNMVIDHLNYDVSDTDYHTLITTKEWRQVPIMTGQPKAPVLYRGIGFTLSDKNSLVVPLLTGSSSSFSYSPEQQVEDDSHAALGKNTVLVAALQARNNARVTICGSIEALSNAFFEAHVATATQKFDKSGNEEFFTNLALWTVQERGVVSLSNPRHELVEQVSTPITSNGTYRIGDIIEFNVQLNEWKDGKWVPFQSEEVQFEFVRLDPYVRLPVKGKQGLFTLRFRLPDIYGVFTMKLVHHKAGYSYLTWSDLVSVRPYRHDEYERFIPMAFPYYASVFSMMGGFFIFTFLILYGKK